MTNIVQADDDYNGWSNRATWNANLWLTNDESLYKLVRRIAFHCRTISELADNIEGFLGILWNGKTPDGDVLGMVNWVEIADAWVDAHSLDAEVFFKNLQNESD